MKIKKLILENFRIYKERTTIDFDNLTAFIGKNDIGKSTILEALDIFFNEKDPHVKINKDDLSKGANSSDILIGVVFEDLPKELIIDTTVKTSLKEEYLLNEDENLEIHKIYSNGKLKETSILANHPNNPNLKDLLSLKISELKSRAQNLSIDLSEEDKRVSSKIRKAIRERINEEIKLEEINIPVDKEDAKQIWEKLKNYMPIYALFQSDRQNVDQDSEVQDPMKIAIAKILGGGELQKKLRNIQDEVETAITEIAKQTIKKLDEMNPEIAQELKPDIPEPKWKDAFKKITISSDEGIPLNKRGSGVRRLILLNFFRAEAEKKKEERNVPNIIYAFEEPETSQHPEHQRKLIEAFLELSSRDDTQIILTTHSPAIVKLLEFKQLRLLKKENGKVEVISIEKNELPYPSLNEVNFLAFGEADEEYHNELYGYIESEGKLKEYKNGKSTIKYRREINAQNREDNIILSEFIRHQIHHPENKLNNRFSFKDLQKSIKLMREFIKGSMN